MLSVALARFFSDDDVIRYVLPVLWTQRPTTCQPSRRWMHRPPRSLCIGDTPRDQFLAKILAKKWSRGI